MIFEEILSIPVEKVQLSLTASKLNSIFKKLREESYYSNYYVLFRANDLVPNNIQIISDCGLQRDIRKRLLNGQLSFNEKWLSILNETDSLTRVKIIPREENQIRSQLEAVFSNHQVDVFNINILKCDAHEYWILLETMPDENKKSNLDNLDNKYITDIISKIFLSYLKEFKLRHVSDWEKAVHELSSPLSFIYTNSDFLITYLTNASVEYEKKRLKLEDLKLISTLLINRLHQFRFFFAGMDHLEIKYKYCSIFNLCKPITHLWHHEARNKNLRFIYDDIQKKDVFTDGEIIQFILFNLISNAIKYSNPNTEIKLYTDVTAEGNSFKLGVINEGIKISDSDRYKIFENGYRSEDAKKADARGMGIGLPVSRGLALKLNGSLTLLEDTGNKTIFELKI